MTEIETILITPSTTERLTNQLRFVQRDRDFDPINKKLVLQQMWQNINSGAERWVDVPMGVE